MGALTPGPEDAEKEYNGADNLANSTHSPKTIRAATRPSPARAAAVVSIVAASEGGMSLLAQRVADPALGELALARDALA
jgi:hypothetical protein